MEFNRGREPAQYRKIMNERVKFQQDRIAREMSQKKYEKGEMDFRRKCDRPVYSSDGKCWVNGMRGAAVELKVSWSAINDAVNHRTVCCGLTWSMDGVPENPYVKLAAVIDLDGKRGPWPFVGACARELKVSDHTVRRYAKAGKVLNGVRVAIGPAYGDRVGMTARKVRWREKQA